MTTRVRSSIYLYNIKHMSLCVRKTTISVPKYSQRSMLGSRVLKLMMYYPCSENKGADQIRGYCEADPAPLFSVSFLMRRLLFCSAFTKEKKSTPRYIRVSNNYRHIPAHFNKETHGKPCIFCCACFKSDHAAQFIGNFTEHTQRISSRFSRKL